MSSLLPGQMCQDRQLAYLGLKGHHLGVNHTDNMSNSAEKHLQNALSWERLVVGILK